MATNIAEILANRSTQNNNGSQNQNREPAEFWLNITINGVQTPVGIPLGTAQRKDLSRINSPEFREFLHKGYMLEDALLKAASALEPGESKSISMEVKAFITRKKSDAVVSNSGLGFEITLE